MNIYIVLCFAAFLTSLLTLFSGFGLGTFLMPVFALFFPVDIAIALTAIVHILNNFFKLSLLGKYASKTIVIQFGLPAMAAAFIGAKTLIWFSNLKPIAHYELLGHEALVTPVKLTIAALMILFAVLELLPSFKNLSFSGRYFILGGILSGFFGGISGHQGAFRSAFLVKSGLTKESFIGTGVAIACLVDISRISVYAYQFKEGMIERNSGLLMAAVFSAFLGAWMGSRFMKKVTIKIIQISVAILLVVVALGLGIGII